MSARDPHWPDIGSLALLLAPLPGDDPCGPSLRYDAVMAQIRSAREADDPSLPMGDWERPLKRADWPVVQTLCIELLAYRSKDLHAAAWLLDASVRLQQADGLTAGIRLLCGLVEQQWPALHPRIDDDGDSDARVAPLAWLNETLPLTLQLQLTLLPLAGRKPAQLTLDDWEQLLRGGAGLDLVETVGDEGLPPRDELLRTAGQPAALAHLDALRGQLEQSAAHWGRLNALVDERLGRDAPSLGRVADALARLQRATNQLIAGRNSAARAGGTLQLPAAADLPRNLDASGSGSGFGSGIGASAGTTDCDRLALDPIPLPVTPRTAGAPMHGLAAPAAPAAATTNSHLPGVPAAEALVSSLHSREAAYLTLQAVADYLQAIEPHSPTPYLVRRAISWGAMPLPQLMQEVLREEGDLNRLFAVLGLPQPTR